MNAISALKKKLSAPVAQTFLLPCCLFVWKIFLRHAVLHSFNSFPENVSLAATPTTNTRPNTAAFNKFPRNSRKASLISLASCY